MPGSAAGAKSGASPACSCVGQKLQAWDLESLPAGRKFLPAGEVAAHGHFSHDFVPLRLPGSPPGVRSGKCGVGLVLEQNGFGNPIIVMQVWPQSTSNVQPCRSRPRKCPQRSPRPGVLGAGRLTVHTLQILPGGPCDKGDNTVVKPQDRLLSIDNVPVGAWCRQALLSLTR